MGKPKKVQAAQVGTNYDWGEFGSANENGINLSPMANENIRITQSNIGRYLDELTNPSYNNESFRARQELLDESNRQYATQLGAEAIARGARGSATQNILNAVMANRNANMRSAMTAEDARIQNILSALSGIEGNYFNQANTMGNNILQRVLANQGTQQQANIANTNNYNSWKNNLLGGAASIAGSVMGSMGGALAGGLAKSAFGGNEVTDVNGNIIGTTGGYGTYQPY